MKIAVRLPASSVEVGYDVVAAATATNSAGKPVSLDSIEWSSSDTSVVVVSNVGKVNARKMGNAQIFATWHKRSGKGILYVTDTVPAKVVVSPATANAAVGSQIQLAATVTTHSGRTLPEHQVKWKSTDTQIVSVSSGGVVTGTRTGSARVIAQASSVADTAAVTVSAASIYSLSVAPGTSTIGSGQTIQLSAHAADAGGNQLTGRAVSWTSSDESIASVSSGGVVTGGKVGDATIKATAEGIEAAAAIHVIAGGVKTITITPGSIGLVAGKTQQLAASLEDDAGNSLSAQGVSWSVSNSSIATVSSSGLVTGVHSGSATITASAGNSTGHATVVVSAGAVKTVVITPASFSLVAGGTRQLAVKLTDAAGNTLSGQAVSWASSNNSVATVSSSGMATAVHSGNATITAAAGGASASASLSVTAGSISSVTITPGTASLIAGGTQQLRAEIQDGSGNAITGQTVTWSTSDASVVTVSAYGLATAGKAGKATVTASAGGKTGSAAFSVAVGALNSIAITPASASLQQSKTVQLGATFQDVAGNAVPGGTVTWKSSNTSAATVNGTGLVTGVAAGSASITLTAGGKSKSAAITVTAPIRTDPTLSSIAISPATVTLAANATAQFKTTATWSDGSTTTPAVAYSASGGSISASGLYTAGASSGTFRVVATDAGKADTAIVSITGQVSQGASCSNPLNVNSVSELTSALSQARPGSCILVASGTYTLGSSLTIANSGTSSSPIVVEGAGSSTIIDVNQKTMSISASYLHLRKMRLTNFPTVGLWLRGATGDVLDSVEIDHSQQEAIALKDGSNHNILENSLIHDTGISNGQYAEGIYVGSSGESSPLDFGVTDNQILNNHFGPNVRAEAIDLKEGADRTLIRGNYIDGTGAHYYSGTGTLVAVKSSDVLIDDNYMQIGMQEAVAFEAPVASVMRGNVASNNKIDLRTSGYGFQFQAGTVNPMGAVIKCNNVMISGALSNRPCTP